MAQTIVVLNAGSSSIKFSIFAVGEGTLALMLRGQIEGLNGSARFVAKHADGALVSERTWDPASPPGHDGALEHLIGYLRYKLADDHLIGVGHRVVHGGLDYSDPVRITPEVLAYIEGLVPLFPLHLPPTLRPVRRLLERMPELPQVACFDTAFHPRDLNGFSFVCGLDPVMVGDTAAVCYAIDRVTHKRYIVDAIKITRPTPAQNRQLIVDWTNLYTPAEWIVERNAFQSFLTQDEGIRQFLASKGTILREHHTGNNKWDAGFGVASMSTLFGTKQQDGKHHRDNLIHLPSEQTEHIKSLIEQLITWSPTTKGKTDMVMALWFCEIRAREWLNNGIHTKHHLNNLFLNRYERGKRIVVNIDNLLAEQERQFITIPRIWVDNDKKRVGSFDERGGGASSRYIATIFTRQGMSR